ncbi:MAG: hypothetical protein AB7I08_19375 [Thermoleophilia bacterium]
MSTMTAGSTKVGGQRAIPRAQEGFDMPALARRMWGPMLAMGIMAVGAAVAAGVAEALSDDAATVAEIAAWKPGVAFLGIGFLLSAITFLLAGILGELRDGGTRVQEALGVSPLILRRPWTGYAFPVAMMMGLMVLVAAAVIGVVQAGEVTSDPALAADIGAWVSPLRFAGVALVFTGIALALLTVVKAIGFQSDRLGEIAGRGR